MSVTLNFTREEYAERLSKTHRAMDKAGIDLLIVTDPSNMHWLTGYDGWSFYVHQGVLLPLDGDPIWWGRSQDANGAKRTVWMTDNRIIGYADTYIQSTTQHPMEDLARNLADMGFAKAKARIGVEMDNYYYSAKAHAVLGTALPNVTLVDATALVNWQRMVKSEDEIVFMRKAAAISEKIVRLGIELARPGLKKNERLLVQGLHIPALYLPALLLAILTGLLLNMMIRKKVD